LARLTWIHRTAVGTAVVSRDGPDEILQGSLIARLLTLADATDHDCVSLARGIEEGEEDMTDAEHGENEVTSRRSCSKLVAKKMSERAARIRRPACPTLTRQTC